MGKIEFSKSLQVFKYMADAVLSQAGAVQNTWYTVLDTTKKVRILSLMMTVSVANEDLELKMTIDGETLNGAQANAVAGTSYYCLKDAGSANILLSATGFNMGRYAALDANSVKIEVRKTTANGAGTLSARAVYCKRLDS